MRFWQKTNLGLRAPAQIRLWKGQFASNRKLRVAFIPSARKQQPVELDNSANSFLFGEFTPLSVGGGSLEVTDPSEPNVKLATLPCLLISGGYYTVLIKEAPDGVELKLSDETPGNAAFAELGVRNFVPFLSSLEVSIGTDIHIKLPTPDAVIHIYGLSRRPAVVNSVIVDKSGKQIRTSNEIDFSKVQRADIIISPDAYGRIRSRMVSVESADPDATSKKSD